jgi:hypothetical protein
MFTKTIAALKAAEAAVKEELDALWVPYNPKDGSGGVHWHAAGSGILQNAQSGIAGLRADLEKRQAPIDAAAATAVATEGTPAEEATETPAEETAEVPVVSGGSTDDPPAPEPEPAPEPGPTPDPEPAPPEVTPSA